MGDSYSPETGGVLSWISHVVERVEALRFGSVLIKIHEGQVVLIESTEQARFQVPLRSEPEKPIRKAKKQTLRKS
jgi:hypothetical protein